MNRIYQGRVSKVEIPGDKENPWQPLPNWQDILWQHHELFQDGVNYYTLCLAAMSPDESDMVEQKRSRLGRFRFQVSQTWEKVTTETKPFDGPTVPVSKWLGLSAGKRSFNDCAAKALEGCEQSIRGKGRPAEELESALPGFYWCDRKKRDQRITTVRQLLCKRLRVHLEGEDEAGYSYGLAERTLRGYEELRGKWNEKIVEMGKENQAVLGTDVLKELEALRKTHQKKHKYDFGSAPLYKALLEADYHCVWREPTGAQRQQWKTAQLNYSANPLRDYSNFLDLLADRRRKQKPVSFTPAHAIESPQFFDFPKQSDSAAKGEYITERRGQRGPAKLIHNPTKRDEQGRIVREYPGLCFVATIAIYDKTIAAFRCATERGNGAKNAFNSWTVLPASRIRYLVSYDISDPKRLRKVARSLEGFGVRLQYSVFECPLDDLRLAKLKAELQPLLDHEEDQVLFVSLGPSSSDVSLIIEAMGLPYEVRSRVTII